MVSAVTLMAVPHSALSQNQDGAEFTVRFGVLFENEEPLAGSVTCRADRTCMLFQHGMLRAEILAGEKPHRRTVLKELTVSCSGGCSFAGGRSKRSFSTERQFEFFKGSDSMQMPLVMKPRQKLGEILLTFP
ncbi:hypothetical protein ACRQ1B_05350 [Rhizobium panacihumi]|uniref:hypothetical protein n=1 Tax=Rhizobium panacihumi TaxID=2008450 RepID=UPI003D7AE193